MDVNELWIGDFLRVKSKDKVGRYQGLQGSMIVVDIDSEKFLVTKEDLELVDDPFLTETGNIDLLPTETETKSFPDSILDLHIEVLNPSMTDALPDRIRDYQVEQCKYFISDALSRNQAYIQIIHGKGTGLLKKEIHHLLKMESRVNFYLEKNNGGLTEVWLQPKY